MSPLGFKAGFIWDFDGVVVYTPHYDAWRIAAERFGIRGFSMEFYNRYVSGRPRIEGGKAILEILGREIYCSLDEYDRMELLNKFIEYKNRVFRELIDRGLYKVNDDVIQFILRSRRLGIINVLASASKNAYYIAMKARYKGYKIIDLFDVDVSGSANTKIDVFRKALRILESAGVKRDCIIVFEDSISGARAAHELGIKVVGYRVGTIMGFDYITESLRDKDPLDLLRSLGCKLWNIV